MSHITTLVLYCDLRVVKWLTSNFSLCMSATEPFLVLISRYCHDLSNRFCFSKIQWQLKEIWRSKVLWVTIHHLSLLGTEKSQAPFRKWGIVIRCSKLNSRELPIFSPDLILFIRFSFIHFSRLNSISIIMFWEDTGSASENYQVFKILNHSCYFSV